MSRCVLHDLKNPQHVPSMALFWASFTFEEEEEEEGTALIHRLLMFLLHSFLLASGKGYREGMKTLLYLLCKM